MKYKIKIGNKLEQTKVRGQKGNMQGVLGSWMQRWPFDDDNDGDKRKWKIGKNWKKTVGEGEGKSAQEAKKTNERIIQQI